MSNGPEYLFVGLDIHSKIVAYCVKRADGEAVMAGSVPATRAALRSWAREVPGRKRSGDTSSCYPKTHPRVRNRMNSLSLRQAVVRVGLDLDLGRVSA